MGNYFYAFYVELEVGIVGIVTNYISAMLIPMLYAGDRRPGPGAFFALLAKMSGCAIVMQGICALYYLFFGSLCMPQICCGIMTALYAVVMCKYRVLARVLPGATFFALTANILVVCFSISDMLQLLGSDSEPVIVILLTLTLMTACTLFCRAFSVRKLTDVSVVSVAMVGALALANFVFWIITNVTDMSSGAKIIIGIILIVLLLLAYYSAYAISRNSDELHKRRAEALSREADERMMRLGEENLEALRKLRHELKNQYAYMRVLLERGEYDKLAKYFAEYERDLPEALTYVDCGNRTVNAVIAVEQARARRAGVTLDCRIEVPARLGVRDSDLCSLLMNLVNNAVEYLERNPELTDRTVTLRMRLVGGTLFAEVVNALAEGDGSAALRLRTSKKDKQLHGYGSKIVSAIADKYNGGVRYAAEGNVFRASVTLTEREEEAQADRTEHTEGGIHEIHKSRGM